MSLLINNALLMGVHYNYPSEALYTFAEANNKIINDGYIPVANEDELSNLRTATTQEMGLRTPWQGTYATGSDKKYLIVNKITKVETFVTLSSFSGDIDGNELQINLKLTNPFLSFAKASTSNIKNIKMTATGSSGTGAIGGFINTLYENNIIDNCHIDYAVETGSIIAAGFVYQINGGLVKNSSIKLIGKANAGFVREMGGGTIENCYSDVDINYDTSYVGGFVGDIYGGIIKRCYSIGQVENTSTNVYTGGFAAINHYGGSLVDCYSRTNVLSAGDKIGGFIGLNQSPITNCYTVGTVSGNANIGGFAGLNSGTITNSYWDKTVEPTDNGIAEGKTTTEMQESSIPDTTIYVNWDNTIWNENTTSEYPTLK